jgi:hypothetical protein
MPAFKLDSCEELREAMLSRGLSARDVEVRSSSIVVADRSFEAVVSTEEPAQIVDWRAYEVIDEVLVARGGVFPPVAVLLDSHFRSRCRDVIGSAREFKLEEDVRWAARGFVAEPAFPGDEVELIWSRIKGGHLRAVSIGYEVLEFTDIEPGQKKLVGSKYYTAKERRLRISTKWRCHELSTTPIGADSMALIRSHQGNSAQPKRSYFR